MTQQQLAQLAGVSTSTIAEYEVDKRPSPLLPIMVRVAKALGVSLDWLAGRRGSSMLYAGDGRHDRRETPDGVDARGA